MRNKLQKVNLNEWWAQGKRFVNARWDFCERLVRTERSGERRWTQCGRYVNARLRYETLKSRTFQGLYRFTYICSTNAKSKLIFCNNNDGVWCDGKYSTSVQFYTFTLLLITSNPVVSVIIYHVIELPILYVDHIFLL